MKISVLAVAALSSGIALAEGWSFNAGYAWRSQADTSFRGRAPAAAGAYANGSVSSDGSAWSGEIDELPVRSGGIDTGSKNPGVSDYALRVGRTESVVSGGGEDDSASGLSLSGGYDFYDAGPVSFGANLRFAGYWGIENSTHGGYCSYNDYFRFDNVMGTAPDPDLDSVNPNLADGRRDYLAGGDPSAMRTTLKADLYQIGLGPRVTWHAFDWLDVYGGVEALCTFVNSELDVGGASADEVNCIWGVGGHVGFTGWLTENVGVFGQVGYEWLDKDEVSAGGITAETDYSSLVLSAGLQFRF